jgi:hypothetical protein
MSLLRNHTGFELYPLTAGSNDSPAVAQGSPVTFEFRNVPLSVGNLAYYMYGVILNFSCTIDTAAEAGLVYWDRLVEALIDSIDVRNCWHGTPVSQTHAKGQILKIMEFVGAGYRYVQRPTAAVANAVTDGTLRRLVYIPLSVGCGTKPHHTAQLNLFYKQAQLVINTAAASVLTGISAGADFDSISVKATAVMLPEPEIRLGCGVEWIDYRSPSSTTQEQILLASFGNVTGLTGTIPDAGVLWLGALTNTEMPGSFSVDAVTRYSFPWRGQVPITDIDSLMAQQTLAQNDVMPTRETATGDISSPAGFPFTISRSWAATGVDQLAAALALPMVTEAVDVELTKVQTAKGDQSYFLSGPTFSGTNHTLAQHVRSWDDNKRIDAVRQIVDSGLAKTVIGRSSGLGWAPKLLNKNDTISGDKLRYLPWRLVKEEPRRAAPMAAAMGAMQRRR